MAQLKHLKKKIALVVSILIMVSGLPCIAYGQTTNSTVDGADPNEMTIGTTTELMPIEKTIAAGDGFSLLLKSDGTVWAWGLNDYGELGDGSTTQRATPVQVSGLTDIVGIAAGLNYSLAVKTDGTVWAWGNGTVGDGSTTPVQVSGLTDIVSIAAGSGHSLALKADGTVWAWGYNDEGVLGDGTENDSVTPVQVSDLTNVVSVEAGHLYSLALKSDGTVWAWGYNGDGELGDGTTTSRTTPVQVSGLTNVVSVEAAWSHSLALKSDGTVWAWGLNDEGELGDGTKTQRATPVQVSCLTNIVSIAAGYYHSLAVKTDGTVWAWGNGTVGDGSTTPVQVSGLKGIVSIAAGSGHSLAIKTDGTVWAWGYNSYGQLAQSNYLNSVVPIQCKVNTSQLRFGDSSYTAYKPYSGITVSAIKTDCSGNVTPNANIYYCLADAYPGVTINRSTGEVIIASNAQPGSVHLSAHCGNLSCSAVLTLENYTNLLNIYIHDISDNTDTLLATYTRAQLTDNSQFTTISKHNYSTVGPSTPPWYAFYTAKGPELQEVLTNALSGSSIALSEVEQIKFMAPDGFAFSTTKDELLDTIRYWYDTDHILRGTTPAILATSVANGLNASDDSLSTVDTFCDYYGQLYHQDLTVIYYVKNITKITLDVQSFDNAPPIITPAVSPTASTDGSITIIGGVSDLESGVALTKWAKGNQPISYFSGNGAVYSNSFTVTEKGTYTIYAIDNAGNAAVKTISLENLSQIANINVTSGKTSDLPLRVERITDFNMNTFTVTYDPQAIKVIDLCGLTSGKELAAGVIKGTDIEIVSYTEGHIVFKVNKIMTQGQSWSGVINDIKYKGKITGPTSITLSFN